MVCQGQTWMIMDDDAKDNECKWDDIMLCNKKPWSSCLQVPTRSRHENSKDANAKKKNKE